MSKYSDICSDPKINEDLTKLENTVYIKYESNAEIEMNKKCKFRNSQLNAATENSFELNFPNLKAACKDIIKDIKILCCRRSSLITTKDGEPYLMPGKLAGITAFRLSRRHIVHIHPNCLNCADNDCRKARTTLNNKLAIICAMEFIGRNYTLIPQEITREIIFTLIHRHMNQETLGIVFDTIKRCDTFS